MRAPRPSHSLFVGSLWLIGCVGGSEDGSAIAAAGGRGAVGMGQGAAGSAPSGTAGSNAAGSTNGSGSAGSSGMGGRGAMDAAGGASAGDGEAAGAAGSRDAAPADGPASEASGPIAKEGCSNNDYVLCIDFENGIDKNVWTSGNANSVVTTQSAHGAHSYHAYPGGGFLKTTQMGAIKNVVWGRFYLHMSPGAPGGHGEIVGVYDTSGDWYEMGWQFNGLLGNWHGLGGEKPLRSMPHIVDKWYCVEYLFDGAKGVMPAWWIDDVEAAYYMPVPNAKGPRVETQFTHLEVGFTSFAGLGLNQEPYGNNNPPVLTDMWLDDVAFDTKRIGCIL